MRLFTIFVIALLAGCGTDSGGGTAATASPEPSLAPLVNELARIDINNSAGIIGGTAAIATYPIHMLKIHWHLVVAITEGKEAPAACTAENTKSDRDKYVILSNLVVGQEYSLRACAFNVAR